MELEEYRKDLLETVKATALNNEEGTTSSFVQVIANKLLESEVLPDFYPCFYVGTTKRGKRMKVDGYAFDEFDSTLYVIIAEFSGSEFGKIHNKSEVSKIFENVNTFIDQALNGKLQQEIEISTAAYDLIDLLQSQQDNIRKYKFLLLTDNLLSERVESLPTGDLDGIQIEYHIWDITRLFRVLSSNEGINGNEINFEEFNKNGIPCIEASFSDTSNYRSFLCVIPGDILADIYDKYGSHLLEGNVRSFLSTKVAVNKRIRQTILHEPEMFFAYNNGISATATDLIIEDGNDGKYLKFAKDFQIVNGGQTTASISSARYKDKARLEKINVQMKLTLVKADEAVDIIPNISRSSNSQNKVSEADFFSNHQFHIRMEQISRRVYAPAMNGAQHETHWYYERARGQYLQSQMKLTKSEKGRFELQNPKSQLITKTDLAKYQNSWKCLPHIVSRGIQTNFVQFAGGIVEEWEKSEHTFNEEYFKESIALAILFDYVERLVSNQSWYTPGGYRANIVTYSISLLSYLINKSFKNKTLDLQLIWNKQSISDDLNKQFIILTKIVNDHINDNKREVLNVTQWCKREKCWSGLKSLDIDLIDCIENVLIDNSEKKQMKSEFKVEQKLMHGIEAEMLIFNLGIDYWYNIKKWGIQRNLLTPEEINTLVTSIDLLNNSKIPNQYKNQDLQKIRNRMKKQGFTND
ncbi:AIPR family protein [Paenibacillus sp. GP183]|uniref:AIPR family protein n=1 Tax=Paenibacillus sp. GP183 TaxID=1882751 RepID=UPI00089D3DD3|nr:AIPR family protein [Paenibacillus sp. GP183]SED07196.1 AIPR protein [Paenibacillus sp. GP183]